MYKHFRALIYSVPENYLTFQVKNMCILFRPDIFNLLSKERYEDINFATDEKDKTKTGV